MASYAATSSQMSSHSKYMNYFSITHNSAPMEQLRGFSSGSPAYHDEFTFPDSRIPSSSSASTYAAEPETIINMANSGHWPSIGNASRADPSLERYITVTEPFASTSSLSPAQVVVPPMAVAIPRQTTPDPPQEKERKHACEMCHKKFDRPSTLKKHLLVHTGEKAFQCDTCGRRFGVASNLNRHVKKCVLRPVNNKSTAVASTPSPPSASSSPDPGQQPASIPNPPSRPATSPMTAVKRRRRAPPPVNWIPESLKGFMLAGASPYFQSKVPVPLPPVRPSYSEGEERDSWDQNVGMLTRPYHPTEFVKLPGPATGVSGMRGVRNLGGWGGGDGDMWGGQVLVF